MSYAIEAPTGEQWITHMGYMAGYDESNPLMSILQYTNHSEMVLVFETESQAKSFCVRQGIAQTVVKFEVGIDGISAPLEDADNAS